MSSLCSASFTTKAEVDLTVGKEIRTKVESGQSGLKGSHRMVSKLWMTEYLTYIAQLEQRHSPSENGIIGEEQLAPLMRPGPMANFNLLYMMPEYTQLMMEALSMPADTWSDHFKDWSLMSIREDIEQGKDYVLVTQAQWLKLVKNFGGAPEIPIFQWFMEVPTKQPDGSTSLQKSAMHDFYPIKVNVFAMDAKLTQATTRCTVLASQFLTNKTFLNTVVMNEPEFQSTKHMYVVKPYTQAGDDLPIIYEVPQQATKLCDLGIQEGANVVMSDVSGYVVNSDGKKNYNALIYAIGKHFEIPLPEIKALLHEVVIEFKPDEISVGQSSQALTSGNLHQFDRQTQGGGHYDGFAFRPPAMEQPKENVFADIPAEYANDPELWQAMQASMADVNEPVQNKKNYTNDVLKLVEDEDNFGDHIRQGYEGSIPLTNLPHNQPQDVNPSDLLLEAERTHSTGQNQNLNAKDTSQQASGQHVTNTKEASKRNLSKAEYMLLLREKRREKFVTKREQASRAVTTHDKILPDLSKAACKMSCQEFETDQIQLRQSSMRGQLGYPLKQFSELQVSLSKLRQNFDSIMSGAPNEDAEMLSHSDLRESPQKQSACQIEDAKQEETCLTDDDHCDE